MKKIYCLFLSILFVCNFTQAQNFSANPSFHSICVGDTAYTILTGNNPAGTALYFDGINGYVDIPAIDISSGNQLTLEAWVKPEDITTNTYYEIIRQQGGGSPDWLLSFQDNGTILSFGLNTTAVYQELDVTIIPSNYTNGNWHHIAAVYDGVKQYLYVDGVQIGSKAKTGNVQFSLGSTCNIGAYNGGAEPFKGMIDEVRIWNTARTVNEIVDNMNVVVLKNSSGLKAYYSLDEGSGNTTTDLVTSNSMGTSLNGGFIWMPSTAPIEYIYSWWPLDHIKFNNKTKTDVKLYPDFNTNYNITATNAMGSNSGQNVNVNVNGSHLNSSADTACPNENISFYLYPNGNNYNWNFGDGATSNNSDGNHAYNMPGNYTITVTANTSCGNSTFRKGVVIMDNAKPNASFNMSSGWAVCPNDIVSFYPINNNGASYSWSFGDGTTAYVSGNNNNGGGPQQQHSYGGANDYIVTLTLTSTCGTRGVWSNTVHIQDGLHFNGYINLNVNPSTSCPNQDIMFNTYYQSNNYKWHFGDGDSSTMSNPNHKYITPKTYTVSLTIKNGCGFDTTVYTTVNIVSNAPFSNTYLNNSSPSCPNDNVYFEASDASSYSWQFGDGNSGNGRQTSHKYANFGTYTVSVVLTNGCGNTTTLYGTVVITNTIVPVLSGDNFGSPTSTACPGDSMIFYSFGGASNIWYFGDGDSTSVTTPLFIPDAGGYADLAKHKYASVGTYTVTLKYFNACGKYATGRYTITINYGESVDGGFGPLNNSYSACTPIDFLAIGGSTYQWHFGDGDTTTTIGGNATHAYGSAGTYTLSVKIINSCGNSATITQIIMIDPIPSPTVTAQGNSLMSTLASAYQWYRNGIIITGANNQSFNPAISGLYKVLITNMNGCTAFSNELCFAAVDAGAGAFVCSGGSAQLNALGGNAAYMWQPASGLNSSTIANPLATLTITTTYTVTVMLGTCMASDTVSVKVAGALTANPGANTSLCKGSSVNLNASGGGNYSWLPAKGLSSTNVNNPVASPTATTTYTLTVASGICSAKKAITITVNPVPTVNAGSDKSICNGQSVQLSSSGGPSYMWSPSTGLNSTSISNPVSMAGVTTNYILTVTNGFGCSNTDDVTITVNPRPVVNAGADVPICTGNSTTLNGFGTGTIFKWTPSAGLSSTSITNPSASPSSTTTYNLLVTNSFGCSASNDVVVIVNSFPLADAGPDAGVCSGGSAQLNATGGTSYLWSPATALSDANIANPVASPTSNTTYTVTVTQNGCSVDDVVNVNVSGSLIANAGSNTSICIGNSVTLSGSGGGNYSWLPTTGLSNPGVGNPVASPTATTTYTMEVSSGACSGYDVMVVTVNPLPVVTISTTYTIVCLGVPTFTISGSPAGGVFSGAGLTGNMFNPTTAGVGTHTVTYSYSDINTCSNNRSASISVTTCLGVNESAMFNSLNVFPNPTGGLLNVKLVSDDNFIIKLISMNGQVLEQEQYNSRGEFSKVYDMSNYAKGIYYLQIISNKGSITTKVMLQ